MVQLAIEFLNGPSSGMDDSHEWEAVTELSFEATETTAVVVVLMADTNAPFRSFELPLGSGWYRMRGHAIGRSLDFDAFVSEPREHHLLQLWRVDQFDDPQVIRADDPWERQRYTD